MRAGLFFSRRSADNLLYLPGETGMELSFTLQGVGNTLVFGTDCHMGGSVTVRADRSVLLCGTGCSAMGCNILLAGEEQLISIGDECMFAVGIGIRTHDSHSIFDLETEQVINPPQDVRIGRHVWLGERCAVMKGRRVGTGAIVGAGSIVTRDVPDFCLVAGVPARLIRRKVSWSRAVVHGEARAVQMVRALKSRLGYAQAPEAEEAE